MRTRGAVISTSPGRYETMELELDEPGQDELLVRMVASGLCHSDDHLATGDLRPSVLPMAGGHEGSGVVERVGPHTPGFEVGDHVVFSFLPACGRCRWCATGQQNLCTFGATILSGSRPGDPESFRLHTLDGQRVAQLSGVSTFCEHTVVSVMSAVKVPKDLPLETLCLLGCGVGTGWGASVHSAELTPGDTVIIMGIGGIGINAVQGAAHAGASHVIAVDPVAMKREAALRTWGRPTPLRRSLRPTSSPRASPTGREPTRSSSPWVSPPVSTWLRPSRPPARGGPLWSPASAPCPTSASPSRSWS